MKNWYLFHPTRPQDNSVCCCADLVLLCKNFDDREIQEQISSIKADSEKKCGTNVDPINGSPLSGKRPHVAVAKTLPIALSRLLTTSFALTFPDELLVA